MTAFILTSRSRGTTKKNIPDYDILMIGMIRDRVRVSSGTVWRYKCTHREADMHRRLSLIRPSNHDTSS